MSAAVFAVARPSTAPTGATSHSSEQSSRSSVRAASHRGHAAHAGSFAVPAGFGDARTGVAAPSCEWVPPRPSFDSTNQQQLFAAAVTGFLPVAATESSGRVGAFCMLGTAGPHVAEERTRALRDAAAGKRNGKTLMANGMLAFTLGLGCFWVGEGVHAKNVPPPVTPCATAAPSYKPAAAERATQGKGLNVEEMICARWYVGSLNALG